MKIDQARLRWPLVLLAADLSDDWQCFLPVLPRQWPSLLYLDEGSRNTHHQLSARMFVLFYILRILYPHCNSGSSTRNFRADGSILETLGVLSWCSTSRAARFSYYLLPCQSSRFYQRGKHGGFKPDFKNGYSYAFPRAGSDYKNRLPGISPEFTVIIRTRDREDFLALTLKSLENQTYRNFRVIVVEDGQNPVSREVAEQAAKRLTVQCIPIGENCGRSHAGNVGLEAAQTPYICFLDDDDYLFADHFEVISCLIEKNPECNLFLVNSVEAEFAINNRENFPLLLERMRNYRVSPVRRVDFAQANPLPIQSFVFHRDIYLKHGGFDERLDALEDWDLWLRYVTDSQFVYEGKTTSIFRMPKEQKRRKERETFIRSFFPIVYENMRGYMMILPVQEIYDVSPTPVSFPKR